MMGAANEKIDGLECQIKTPERHTHTIIWMHGLGDNAGGWFDTICSFQKKFKTLKVICPTAPVQPVTLNMGMPMTSWHDLVALDKMESKGQFAGIDGTGKAIMGIIANEEKSGIKSENIIVGGFSQGGAMALYCGLHYPNKLCALVVCSGYLPMMREQIQKTVVKHKVPLLMCHGDADPVVQTKFGQATHMQMKAWGFPTGDLKLYKNMGHSACPQELADIGVFLGRIVADKK